MNSIFNRKSIRKFNNEKVDRENIESILKAAMQAPSAGNQQAWEFIVVENKETLVKLSEVSPYAGALKTAPAAIIVLGNQHSARFPQNIEQDLAACCENILLQIVNEGLTGVWLGIAPEQNRIEFFNNYFKLPDNILPFAIIPFGKTDQEYKIDIRYNAAKVHYEKY